MRALGVALLCALLLCVAARAADDILATDSVGGLKIGMSEQEAAKVMGGEGRKGANKKQPDGASAQLWEYRGKGVLLLMRSPKKGAPHTLATITLEGKCTLTTSRGIKLGMTEADVRKAYGADIDRDSSSNEVLVAGSVKGAIVFTLDKGKVSRIFLGALTSSL